jgi:hypothetical protein
MALTVSYDPSLDALAGAVVCVYTIRENATQTARIDYMSCGCSQQLDICIAQGADKTFTLQDATTVDYSSATEITFDIWESVNGGASVLSFSLTGGDIVLANAYSFTFDISGTESAAMTATRKHCEAWVTLSGGERRMVGAGAFRVQDTRKFD